LVFLLLLLQGIDQRIQGQRLAIKLQLVAGAEGDNGFFAV
jgi:hypothetical protein